MNETAIEKERQAIIAQIMKYVPLMRPFFELDESVNEHSKNLYNFHPAKVHAERQKVIRSILSIDLEEPLAFNIVDHHMILNHPLLLSTNIISCAKKYLHNQKPKPIVVISSGDIPPNNFFSKGGFTFHGKRVPLFSVSEREYSSHYIPKREFNFVARLKKINRWGEFNTEEQKFLLKQQDLINSYDFSNCENYEQQVSVIVKNTWPLLFEEKIRASLPDLIYVTQESLVTACLIELLKTQTLVSDALFDSSFRNKILDNFRGIVTTWREDEQKGTHFFWRKYPGEPRSLRMFLEGENLVPADSRFLDLKVHMDKDTIIKLLKSGEIYPSLFTIFAVLIFYAGIRPLTGHGSATYLELFKQAWLKTLAGTEHENEIDLIQSINTAGLICGPILIFKREQGGLKAPYAFDLIFDGGIKAEYLKRALEMKFKDVLSVGLPDMYDYFKNKYVPENEKLPLSITADDLAELSFDWIK